MELEFRGTLRQSDLAEGIRLSTPRRTLRVLVGALLVMMSLFSAGALIRGPWHWGVFGLGVYFLLAGAFMLGHSQWSAWIAWRNSLRVREEVRGRVSAEGIRFESNTSTTDLKWEGIIGYLDSPRLVMVFVDRRVVHILTRAMFSGEEDWTSLCTVLRDRIPRHVVR